MILFSPLSEFRESDVLGAELEKFLLTTTGQQFIAAMREFALGLGGAQAGTVQDGARACVEMMLELTMSRRNERKKGRTAQAMAAPKRLLRKEPPPPSSRYPKPDPEKNP